MYWNDERVDELIKEESALFTWNLKPPRIIIWDDEIDNMMVYNLWRDHIWSWEDGRSIKC